ncbi:MAG TPA: DUF3379 family protein [Burkholderiales bacterium]
MNCLDFHRAKLAEPTRLGPEAQSHAAQCAACAAFAHSVDETERDLERALATPVPDGLADRVLLRVHGRRPAWYRWALAASVAIVVAVGLARALYVPAPGDQYARKAIEHVAMEPESLSTVDPTNVEALGELIRASGGTLKAPLGTVRYVRLCPVENGTALHIVFETGQGLATVLIVPGRSLPQTQQQASTSDWNALARAAGHGYYAVVTPSGSRTAQVDRLIRERIDWNA